MQHPRISKPLLAHRRLLLAEAVAAAFLMSACGGGGPGASVGVESVIEETAGEGEPPESPPMNDDAVVERGETAPASSEDYAEAADRESAATLNCTAPYAKPKVAAYDMTRDTSSTRQALLAKFGLAVVNIPYSASASATNAFTSGIKSRNSNIKLAQFIPFPALRPNAASTEYHYGIAREVNANDWWLRYASDAKATWTSGTTYGVNMTSWAAPNAAGQRYPQFKAQYDYQGYLSGTTGIDYVYTADTWAKPRVDADWRRNGTNQLRTDTTIQNATRAGYAAYWSSLRTRKAGIKIMAGLDNSNDLSSVELKSKVEGAYLDGMIGKSWSLEAWKGWTGMMSRYRAVVANTMGDKAVIFHVYGESPTDYKTMRYGFASALLDRGHFAFTPKTGSTVPAWYDEYAAPLGVAVDAPPTTAASNGIFKRRFENGIVLVNPRSVSASINVGTGYKRLSGTQDPSVNNGQTQTTVTLPARSGLIMVRTSTSCTSSVPAGSAALAWTPPAAAVKGYRIYYGQAAGTYYQTRGNGIFVSGTSHMLSGLSSGHRYYFAVTSVGTDGKESSFSQEVSKAIQ
jgi:hypothetical protein